MNDRYNNFLKILKLSETMYECAQNGAWLDLGEAEAKRQALMTEFFDTSISESEVDWLEPGIQQVLRVDKLIVQISKNELHSITDNMQRLKKGKQGADAYQQNL